MIRGVLFDMDGVLVDSETYICKAAIKMFSEFGKSVRPEDFQPFIGMGENRYLGGVAELKGIRIDIVKAKARTYEIYAELAKDALNPLPGAIEFVMHCRKKGLKLALATSADRVKMLINLKGIGLTVDSFDSIITGEDVVNKKPSPDIYIKAAESISCEPKECLVVEDAVSGVRAGKAAGSRCLAVTTSFAATALHEADWICASLSNVPAEVLSW
jgi:beta-phosphoglucomutase